MGNEVLHLLTNQGVYSMRVEMMDWEGNSAHSHYDRFTLTSERQQYRYNRSPNIHTQTVFYFNVFRVYFYYNNENKKLLITSEGVYNIQT